MNTPFPILLVEDDLVDVMSIRRAIQELKVNGQLTVAGNGEEALVQLKSAKGSPPRIIVLDLNMPRMNGIDFLKVIKADEMLRRIPVIILTTSKEEKDLSECFDLGVAGYMTKPVDYAQFVDIMRTVFNYWNMSEAPPVKR